MKMCARFRGGCTSSCQDWSFDKVSDDGGEDRRSSVPLVGTVDEEKSSRDSMESTSATSRFAFFFSKKRFRSTLNRAKSATKLSRRQPGPSSSDRDTSSLVGTLKRTMSLGRLARKRSKTPTQAEDNTPSLISSRIRSARSHESLLSSPNKMQTAGDGARKETDMMATRNRILGRRYNAMPYDNTNSPRDQSNHRWFSSLQHPKKVNPEDTHRVDSSLKLWIAEAKNLQPKKQYYCEIFLDDESCNRTSSKLMSEMLFWGEHFEFEHRPVAERVTVKLFREADKKKKKDHDVQICSVTLNVADIPSKQFVEKWYIASCDTVGKIWKETKGEVPTIRMKVRHQTVHILPVSAYEDFSKYLKTDYQQMCDALEPQLSLREKEEFATALVRAMHRLGKATDCLCDIIMAEIGKLDDEHLTFRGNSIATKAMEAYMKLVGKTYLINTLGEFIREKLESEEDCEVDPSKANSATLQEHQKNLAKDADNVWRQIILSDCYFPNELREVFTRVHGLCCEQGKEEFSDNLISASIFLRFLCPAILSPSLFNLTQAYPHERAARRLTLIAKTIQTLANFTKFGGKEEYMTFMNGFVEKEAVSMRNFLRKISSKEGGNQYLQFEGHIDLGRELSLLHIMLLDYIHRSPETTQEKFSGLSSILATISKALEDHPANQQQDGDKAACAGSPGVHQDSDQSAGQRSVLRSYNTPFWNTPGKVCQEGKDRQAAGVQPVKDARNQTKSAPEGLVLSPEKAKALSEEFSALYVSTSGRLSQGSSPLNAGSGKGASVSGSSQFKIDVDSVRSRKKSEDSADDSAYGDYIDLIRNTDDEGRALSSEAECPAVDSSQLSISQLSAAVSSGYQSLAYSQRSSPVEGSTMGEMTREVPKSPIIQYPMQPLSFANPLYRHQQLSQDQQAQQQQRSGDKTNCESSDGSQSSARKSERSKSVPSMDPLRKLSQLSSSSGSNESLNSQTYVSAQRNKILANCRRAGEGREGGVVRTVQFSIGSRESSPAQHHSSPRTAQTKYRGPSPDIPPRPVKLLTDPKDTEPASPPTIPPRVDRSVSYNPTTSSSSQQRSVGAGPYPESHSMDFSSLPRKHTEQMRRTATDSVIVKTSTPVHMFQGSSGSPRFSREDSFSSVHSSQSQGSLSSRRLSPQGAMHMGISSVQHRLQEQERTKQEYESEIQVLQQQLKEAQVRLESAETRLVDNEVETSHLKEEWQSRLAESEQLIRQQQAEKDGQMKSIIDRLLLIEEELRREQAEMQRVIQEKQQIIDTQEQRLHTLDTANAELRQALTQLKDQSATTPTPSQPSDDSNNNPSLQEGPRPNLNNRPHNGIARPVRSRWAVADFTGFKSSTC